MNKMTSYHQPDQEKKLYYSKMWNGDSRPQNGVSTATAGPRGHGGYKPNNENARNGALQQQHQHQKPRQQQQTHQRTRPQQRQQQNRPQQTQQQHRQHSQQQRTQQKPVKQLGLTSAISLAEPCTEELLQTAELNKALEPFDVFETQAELNQRMQILAKLNTLVKQWIKDVSLAKHVPEAAADKLGGKVYTFGSYRLGVHHRGADIDALCVAPIYVERTDYFTTFFELLKQQAEVTECRAVEEAFVPVIKMKFDNIEIDLLFASLSLKEIPDDFSLSDNNLLRNLDPRSVRSLNGCRVTDEILELVPNIDNFRLTLRAIKLWAKKHGIYSNSLGYFGGVTWAMLVARTCQLYPNATAATLVQKFFLVFSRWQWPHPVLLRQPENVNLQFPVWDPRVNAADRYHLMPIITPAYPQQNSTFNVLESTKKVIVYELNRGLSTVDEIMRGKASWNRLFEAPSFFYIYRHFLVLSASSTTAIDQLEWCGLIESRIRLLVANLERNEHISLARVHPKCFDYKKSGAKTQYNSGIPTACQAPFCSMWFIGLEFASAKNLNVNLTTCIQTFTDQVMQHAANIKMLKYGMQLDTCHVKRKDLSQYLDKDFLKRERKSMEQHQSFENAISAKAKRSSSEMSSEEEGGIAKKSRSSGSEDSS